MMLDKELQEMLREEFQKTSVTKELIDLACTEGNEHVNDVLGKEISLVPHMDKTLIGGYGDMSDMLRPRGPKEDR